MLPELILIVPLSADELNPHDLTSSEQEAVEAENSASPDNISAEPENGGIISTSVNNDTVFEEW